MEQHVKMKLPIAFLFPALILISGNTNLVAQSGQFVDELMKSSKRPLARAFT